jgi:hypothetical protein
MMQVLYKESCCCLYKKALFEYIICHNKYFSGAAYNVVKREYGANP